MCIACPHQLAVALLILFIAYALQVRFRPFMSPAEYRDVVLDHQVKSLAVGVHASVAAAIHEVEARGRKGSQTHMRMQIQTFSHP
jgi:hypothetical protein